MNDEKIITAIRNQDASAIHTVIEQYAKLMWSIVSPILKETASVQDVEECVADIFIYLWQHPEKYDPARGTLKTWLSILARSQAIDRYRALSKRDTLPLEENSMIQTPDVMEAVFVEETNADLAAAIQSLEEPDREILIRRYYRDQKPREIAKAMALPVKSIENRLYRAKQKLRKQITK